MLPEIWGKYCWNFIHLITLEYPENPSIEDKKKYYEYFFALQKILPCEKCRNNLKRHLNKYPLTDQVLSCRTNLVKWGIDIHNVVNYYTGKSLLSYNEGMNEINKLVDIGGKKNNYITWIFYFIIIVTIMILCFFIYFYIFKNKKLNI